jgi:hypothetical protein
MRVAPSEFVCNCTWKLNFFQMKGLLQHAWTVEGVCGRFSRPVDVFSVLGHLLILEV